MNGLIDPTGNPAEANNQIIRMALACFIVKNGGSIKLSAKELGDMPDGAMTYQFNEDGSAEFRYVEDKDLVPGATV